MSRNQLKVSRIEASSVPRWFLGGLLVLVAVSAAAILAVVYVRTRPIDELGPIREGEPFYRFARVDESEPLPLEGLESGFYQFVMKPNEELSKRDDLRQPEAWDRRFFAHVAASVAQHVASWSFFERLENVRESYGLVAERLRDQGMPEVFAAIPYQESLYEGDAQSDLSCAKGPWQFMPEVAKRAGLRVEGCRFSGVADFEWSPKLLVPPASSQRDYVRDGRCRIPERDGCRIDERTDLERATNGAMRLLREALLDEALAMSGAAVQIAIASHNAGYDDRAAGLQARRDTNLKPAFEAWAEDHPRVEHHAFYGRNLTCDPTKHDPLDAKGMLHRCGSVLPNQTQHYVYPIVAQHLIAVCYYAKNYGSQQAFAPWRHLATGDASFCGGLEIPTPRMIEDHQRGRPE